MTQIMFNFDTGDAFSQQFTMGKACLNPSTNPALVSSTCIYVISNTNVAPPTVYVGYAADARHRWLTRTEVFHDFGISHNYGKNIKCAWCYPKVSKAGIANPVPNNAGHWEDVDNTEMDAGHSVEHLLIRCMANGVMGVVTVTNTKMRNMFFDRSVNWPGLDRTLIYFGAKFAWPAGNGRQVNIINNNY